MTLFCRDADTLQGRLTLAFMKAQTERLSIYILASIQQPPLDTSQEASRWLQLLAISRSSPVSRLSAEAPDTLGQRLAIRDLVLDPWKPQAENGGFSYHLACCGFHVATGAEPRGLAQPPPPWHVPSGCSVSITVVSGGFDPTETTFAELYGHMFLSVFLLCESTRGSPVLISMTACVFSGYTVGTQNNFSSITNA